MADTRRLVELDKAHVWHPFTPMRQWRDPRNGDPLVIERAEGEFLFDTDGKRYIDGVSSLWCNVHGHRVPSIDQAIRDQLDKVAHSTLLGLASGPSIELAAELVKRAPAFEGRKLNKVFYSDAGATAVEVALKMAVGYWFHKGQPRKNRFVAFRGAYHGDTTGSMSIGFSDLFHRPFGTMVFEVLWAPIPESVYEPSETSPTPAGGHEWPSELPAANEAARKRALASLESILREHAGTIAGMVLEPVMQGAAGMIAQPPGFVRGVADLARQHNVLLIADEVATGFGRTGHMFACQRTGTVPDLMCVAKGITAGYLPLAATLATDEIYDAFCGELADKRTLYHGHTYTGNALACAAALASLDLFDRNRLLERINASTILIADRLSAMRDPAHFPNVIDVRQRGLMVGIELGANRQSRTPFDFARRTAAQICLAMRPKGVFLRPLGDVLVLMPIPASRPEVLHHLLDVVLETLESWPFA